MIYQRGDRVEVSGFRGVRAVLRVWESREPAGLVLCTERGYYALRAGLEAALVGFPMQDIKGLARDEERETPRVS